MTTWFAASHLRLESCIFRNRGVKPPSEIPPIDNWALSGITGSFLPRPYERAKQAVQAMEKIETYQKEISNLRAQIQETTQMNIRVDLNTSIHQLNAEDDGILLFGLFLYLCPTNQVCIQ